jgi:hypothetical protein
MMEGLFSSRRTTKRGRSPSSWGVQSAQSSSQGFQMQRRQPQQKTQSREILQQTAQTKLCFAEQLESIQQDDQQQKTQLYHKEQELEQLKLQNEDVQRHKLNAMKENARLMELRQQHELSNQGLEHNLRELDGATENFVELLHQVKTKLDSLSKLRTEEEARAKERQYKIGTLKALAKEAQMQHEAKKNELKL